MDTGRAAKFPFLKESSEFAEKNSAELEDLLTSSNYEPARIRGVQRVMDALKQSEVSYTPLMNDYDRLMEVMSYPYARMVVSLVGDRFLTKRYALAEAVRMNRLLSTEDHQTVRIVSEELGVESSVDADGIMRIKFTDYLMLSSRLKAIEWKLINSDIHNGMVYLPQDKFSRLMQNALQDRIESELPLQIPEEVEMSVKDDVMAVKNHLAISKSKYNTAFTGELRPEILPPCIRTLLSMAQSGVNLPHSGRFALVSFLNKIGLSLEQILALFAESPDFDESKSIYQIKHITGELSGTEGYTPPECSTMKTMGICYEPDELCSNDRVNHPLTYFRIKMR